MNTARQINSEDQRKAGEKNTGPEGGFTIVDNRIFDEIFPTLTPHQQVVFLHIFRLSEGFHIPLCNISVERLIERTQIKRTKLLDVIKELEDLGILLKLKVHGKASGYGINMKFVRPVRNTDHTSPPDGHIKRNKNKIKNIKVPKKLKITLSHALEEQGEHDPVEQNQAKSDPTQKPKFKLDLPPPKDSTPIGEVGVPLGFKPNQPDSSPEASGQPETRGTLFFSFKPREKWQEQRVLKRGQIKSRDEPVNLSHYLTSLNKQLYGSRYGPR